MDNVSINRGIGEVKSLWIPEYAMVCQARCQAHDMGEHVLTVRVRVKEGIRADFSQ